MRFVPERLYRDREEELPDWPTAVMLRLISAMAGVRGSQLAAMIDAMNRFIEATYR